MSNRGVIGRDVRELSPIKGTQFLLCKNPGVIRNRSSNGATIVIGRYMSMIEAEIAAYNDYTDGNARAIYVRNANGVQLARAYNPGSEMEALLRINNAIVPQDVVENSDDNLASIFWRAMRGELEILFPSLTLKELKALKEKFDRATWKDIKKEEA